MSGIAEQPFSEVEERYVLAEILKTSTIPPAHLQGFIEQFGIPPLWDQLALPNGRSLSACQRAVTRVRERHGFAAPMPPPGARQNFAPPQKPKKRGLSTGNVATPSQVHPAFNSFPAVNTPSPGQGLANTAQSPEGKAGKKRGRPTKADHEMRAALAAARGEPYPPPKRVRPPKQPADQGDSGTLPVPSGDGEVPVPTGTKQGTSKPISPGQSQFLAFEPTMSSSNERAQSSQAPRGTETMGPDRGASALLAGLQEHAAKGKIHPTQTTANEQPQQEQTPSSEQQQQQSTANVLSSPSTQNEPHNSPFVQQPQQPIAPMLPTPTTQNEPYQTPYQPTSNV